MSRLEIATRILAGIVANPADAYVQTDVAVAKALTIADALIEADREGCEKEEPDVDIKGPGNIRVSEGIDPSKLQDRTDQ